jgi:4'-phosphopantetheinyl transferase
MMIEMGWASPPAVVKATGDEVHVWRASLKQPVRVLEEFARTLAPEEREQAARFRFPEHRDRFLAGRGLQRAILGRYLGEMPGGLSFRSGTRGKPELDGPAASSGIRFNVSNAGDLALYAITLGREVGVDLEPLRPVPDARGLAKSFFSPAETAALAKVADTLVHSAFLNGWTRKEALIKAVGDGLSMPLDAFDVTLTPGEPARLLATRTPGLDASRWTLHALDAGPEWVAAIAVEGGGWTIRGFDWIPGK